jgi:hypothetical protein
MEIGTRVRLTQDVDNYPTCLIRAVETGTIMRITDEGTYWIKLTGTIPNSPSGTTNWKSGTGRWREPSFNRKHHWRKCREGPTVGCLSSIGARADPPFNRASYRNLQMTPIIVGVASPCWSCGS